MVHSLLIVVLAVGLAPARGGEAATKSTCPAATAADPCKRLKGVTHLTDDDVRFCRKGGGVVFIDPMSGPSVAGVADSAFARPDLILITHPHKDHFSPEVLKAYLAVNPKVVLAGPAEVAKLAAASGIEGVQVVEPNQDYTIAGFEFRTLPAYFDKAEWSHPRDHGWVGYVLSLNGSRYYVTGDTQPFPEMAEAKADVLFPLLFGCGGNLEQALKMVKISGAQLVVPVHTGDRIETIKRYLAKLPPGIQSAYYANGKVTPTK